MFTYPNTAPVLLGAGLLVGLATPALGEVIYTGSGTAGRNTVTASAIFDISGDTLTITLENTSPAGRFHNSPADTLSGLFFTLEGNPALVPISATVADSSSIINSAACKPGLCAGVTNVAGEWGYEHGANERIASAKYVTTGLRRNVGNFNSGAAGNNLDRPKSLGGINFGLVTQNEFNPNHRLAKRPLIQDEIILSFTGVS